MHEHPTAVPHTVTHSAPHSVSHPTPQIDGQDFPVYTPTVSPIPTTSRRSGRKPVFSAEDVVREAFDMGLDHFSLSAIARRLGVGASALYRVYDSREAVLDACMVTVAAEFHNIDDLIDRDADWQTVLRSWAAEYWRICGEFPGFHGIAQSQVPEEGAFHPVFLPCRDRLNALDINDAQIYFAMATLRDAFTGLQNRMDRLRGRPDGEEEFDRAETLTDGETVEPEVGEELAEDQAEQTVDFVIAGLENEWPEWQPPAYYRPDSNAAPTL